MNVTEALERVQNPATTPGELSEILMHLSADYAHKTVDLTSVLSKKAEAWLRFRESRESDKQADRAWKSSVEGCLETRCASSSSRWKS
jgi:hypothetical protein